MNIIRVRGRDVLCFVSQGTYTRGMSQFWEAFVKDRKSQIKVPLDSLKGEIFEYALKVGSQINLSLVNNFDGALYMTKELAAEYMTEAEVKERGLTEAPLDSLTEPSPTDRFQPMHPSKHGEFHGKFDHGNKLHILEGMSAGGITIKVDDEKVLQSLTGAYEEIMNRKSNM